MFQIKMIFIIGVIILNLGCSKTIESGEFLGLKIDMTKTEVLTALGKNKNINYIRPILSEEFVIDRFSKNRSQLLNKLFNEDGIVITNDQPNLYMKVTFDRGKVSNIYLAPINDGENLSIEKGYSKQLVNKILSESFLKYKNIYFFNFIPNGRDIKISTLKTNEIDWLFSYDNWSFTGASKYSITRLEFVDNQLKVIKHKWTPIELP